MIWTIVTILVIGGCLLGSSLTNIKAGEKGIVFRVGKIISPPKEPGLQLIIPFVDQVQKINCQPESLKLTPLEFETADKVQLRVSTIITIQVIDPIQAVTTQADYKNDISQLALTIVQDSLPKQNYQELQTDPDRIAQKIREKLDQTANSWGLQITGVEFEEFELF